jgi:multiple sugar transport system substrate-binding protein
VTAFRGLTWDHPGGHAPLAAAAELWAGEIEITWDAQPLEGFESTPIPELARSYDLIVLDHPHLGEARDGLAERIPGPRLLDRLDALWRASLPTGAVL